MQLCADIEKKRYISQQNLIRGSIAKVKSQRFQKESIDHHERLRRNLALNFLSARAHIDPASYREFLRWTNNLIKSILPDYTKRASEFSYLNGLISRPERLNLANEVYWIACRVEQSTALINEYQSYMRDIECASVWGDYDTASEFADEISKYAGQSFHCIQIKIALESLKGGLPQQKQYVEGLRQKFRHGILSFVAYYTSVRNEDRISLSRYTELVEGALSKSKYRKDTKNYLRYRLSGEWPSKLDDCLDILRLEQSHVIYDIYETLISFIQNIISTQQLEMLRPSLQKSIEILSEINDYRLDKIRAAFEPNKKSNLPCRSYGVLDHTLSDSPRNAYKSYRKISPQEQNDPWQTIYAAISKSYLISRGRKQHTNVSKLSSNLDLLASILIRDDRCINSAGTLTKRAQNLSGIPYFRALTMFCYTIFNKNPSPYLQLGYIGLNSPFHGYEDSVIYKGTAQWDRMWEGSKSDGSESSKLWNAFYNGAVHNSENENQILFQAAYNESRGELDRTIISVKDIYSKTSSYLNKIISAWILMSCLIETGDRSGVIDLVASEISFNELAVGFLPISRGLKHFSWSDYKDHSLSLSAAIALDALWRDSDDDSVVTMLRHAFAYQLKHSGCNRPSEFADHLEKYERNKLIYYLRNVCIPSRMDMSRAFKTSKEVIAERQNVCASLIAIDPERTEEYEAEIYQIINRMVIREGLKLVDSSRIHVDLDAITRWAKKNLSEDFSRYKDLVEENIGNQGSFDENLRHLFTEIGARQVYYTPDNQADAVLTDMLIRLRDEFLISSDYGLDYFLSKRIRHQSFIGLIRGPLEFANLITTRDTEFGPYKRNEYWLDRLTLTSPDQIKELERSFDRFSERFDALLIKLKDDKLQIKSSEKSSGIFEINLTTRMLFVIRNLIEAGTTFDDFLKASYLILWSALEPSLAEARRLILEELKTAIPANFDEFRAELRAKVHHDQCFTELSITLADVSTEVQRGLDAAAGWFVKPESHPASQNFTLQQCIDIAVVSASKSHRAFEPIVNLDVSGDVRLQTPDLLVLTDTIFIALDNIRLHSGYKSGAEVQINCSVDEQTDFISLRVESDVHPNVDKDAIRKKLDHIEVLISSKKFGKAARKEGGSGFLKIASALHHAAGGTMRCSLTEEGKFILAIELKPTLYTVTVISGGTQ